jgi:FkbM family methyltransferase
MTITINLGKTEEIENTFTVQFKEFQISDSLAKHWSIPINHAQTILNQINSGMYSRFFEGKKDLRCIDFGANVGLVSLYMAQFCKDLYCVEPTPNHFKLLKELLETNVEGCNIHLSSDALSGTNEPVFFMTGHSTENKITSVDGYGNGKIQVQGIMLSNYLSLSGADREPIDFVKCDIEGGEIFALTNEELKKTKGKIKAFFVECHPSNNYTMESCVEELTSRFKKNGYKVELIDYQTILATYDC